MSQRLVILEQPEPEFYKDEGGRSNTLRCVVSASPIEKVVAPFNLAMHLCYENGEQIEDERGLCMARTALTYRTMPE